MKYYLAIDIGASSGRHIIGYEHKGEIVTEEIYRFPNGMDNVDGHLVWNVERLLEEVIVGIKAAFAKYLDEISLDADQIYFVNQIVEYIVHNGVMRDMTVLQEAPFTDRGSVAEVFSDVSVWLGIKRIIEEINANAAA